MSEQDEIWAVRVLPDYGFDTHWALLHPDEKNHETATRLWTEASIPDHPLVKELMEGLAAAQRTRTGEVDEWKMWIPIEQSGRFYEALTALREMKDE